MFVPGICLPTCDCVTVLKKLTLGEEPGRPAYSYVALNRLPLVPKNGSSRVSRVQEVESAALVEGWASSRTLV